MSVGTYSGSLFMPGGGGDEWFVFPALRLCRRWMEKKFALTPYDRDVNSRLAFGGKMLTELRATSTG